MANNFDANVKLLYAADANTKFAIDDVAVAAEFDVILNVEIGPDLNDIATRQQARVGIRNLTQSVTVATENVSQDLSQTPGDPTKLLQELVVTIPQGWTAAAGDVLQAVASFKVTAGVHTDFSIAESPTFVVS